MPPLTDLAALLGIDIVLCAGALRLLGKRPRLARWCALLLALLLWLPAGAAALPLLAYVRGVSSDLSVTLVALAALGGWRRLRGQMDSPVAARERHALLVSVACAALLLYPAALGWGDVDPYRAGWGSPALLVALLLVAAFWWRRGLRLAPALLALALLGWSAGLLESRNLWDYLIDPWLAICALWHVMASAVGRLRRRAGPARQVS